MENEEEKRSAGILTGKPFRRHGSNVRIILKWMLRWLNGTEYEHTVLVIIH